MPLPSPLADDLPSSSESDRIAFFFVRLLLASCASSSESLPLIERRFAVTEDKYLAQKSSGSI